MHYLPYQVKADVSSTKAPPRSRSRKDPRQLSLTFRTHGGDRSHAKPRPHRRRGNVPHRPRPEHDERHPVHVTLRTARRLPSLRKQTIFFELRRALAKTWREWFRVVQFSVQIDHVHLIVEASDKVALSRGIAGLSIRLARAINRVLYRKGNVFSDRYHARALGTPREVRNGLVYVLLNFRKHLDRPPGVDPASSGFWFEGWKLRSRSVPPGFQPGDAIPVQPARGWLARVGWRRHGLIDSHERPA
jgi:REP element-mobilizing transposase RayT